MGERAVGRPAWALSSTVPPTSKNLPSSSERSAWGRRAATPRGISSEEMGGRGREAERAKEKSRSRRRRRRSNRERSPSPRVARRERDLPVLGRTSGMAAVGAWAARYEIANLLTAKCNPNDLVRAIHRSEEGEDDILYRGNLLKLSPSGSRGTRSERGSTTGHKKAESDTNETLPLLETEEEGQQGDPGEERLKVREAMAPDKPSPPPWAKSEQRTSTGPPSRPRDDSGDPSLKFAKPANPPKKRAPEKVEDPRPREKPGGLAEGEKESFSKRAKPPRSPSRVMQPGPLTLKTLGGRPAQPKTVKERETKDLQLYHELSLEIFGALRIMGVSMDLMELVLTTDGKVIEDRFSLHTAPNRASTGLRYARLMGNLIKWGHQDERPIKEGTTPFDRLCTLEFIEHLIQKGCGSHTPRSVLLALDYYGKAFGFESQKGHFGRAKRLSLRCSENPIRGRVGAPLFGNGFINALECLVMDPFMRAPQRIAAGKLRLCIQSSTRFDDILNTPLSQCEWVRKKGELSIIGLRSRALRGKNKARAWIASTLGITPSGDKWLPTLMDLLLKSRGESWKTDDHMGKLAARDGRSFHDSPARMDADVNVLKNVLLENLGQNGYVDVTEGEIMTMRWHGAKATLTTVMQHINLPARVVRFAGDWSAVGESMADLYLREAQLLTLDAQQKAIRYLRMGGEVVGFDCEPVFKEPRDEGGKPFSADAVVEAMAGMDVPEVAVHEVAQELYDKCFENGLPDMDLVESEVHQAVEQKELEPLLEEVRTEEYEDLGDWEMVKSEEGGRHEEKVNQNEKSEVRSPSISLSSDDGGGLDEAMVASFVMVAKPTATSKLHLRLAESKLEVLGSSRPLPKCGARGVYETLRADEHMSAGLCCRCFGKVGCDHLCTWTQVDDQGTGKLRCSRRCCTEDSEHVTHLCAFHS